MRKIFEIEGGEGSGKSTLIEGLKKELPNVYFTREPGGCEVSENIRKVIMDNEMTPVTEALLFAACRAELVSKLKDVETDIILDRYYESSLVYQGYAGGIEPGFIYAINKLSLNVIEPDIVFYLDIPPEEGMRRIRQNGRETNRLDEKSMEFQRKIREGFLNRAKCNKRYVVIDASQSPEKVLQDVLSVIKKEIL